MKSAFSCLLIILVVILSEINVEAQDTSGTKCRRSNKKSKVERLNEVKSYEDRFAEFVIEKIRKTAGGDDDPLLEEARKLNRSDTRLRIRGEILDRLGGGIDNEKEVRFKKLLVEVDNLLVPANQENFRKQLRENPKLRTGICPFFLCSLSRSCCPD